MMARVCPIEISWHFPFLSMATHVVSIALFDKLMCIRLLTLLLSRACTCRCRVFERLTTLVLLGTLLHLIPIPHLGVCLNWSYSYMHVSVCIIIIIIIMIFWVCVCLTSGWMCSVENIPTVRWDHLLFFKALPIVWKIKPEEVESELWLCVNENYAVVETLWGKHYKFLDYII